MRMPMSVVMVLIIELESSAQSYVMRILKTTSVVNRPRVNLTCKRRDLTTDQCIRNAVQSATRRQRTLTLQIIQSTHPSDDSQVAVRRSTFSTHLRLFIIKSNFNVKVVVTHRKINVIRLDCRLRNIQRCVVGI